MNDPRPLWHGRFQEGPSDELLAFTTSLGYDRELAVDDLAGSRAHVNGARCVTSPKSKSGIGLPKPDAELIAVRLRRARQLDTED